ncbi:type 1 glutamine amidotransferase domain-containing protein [Chimaeribacter arupi]|uniref:Type 1 glutamine amidotransferase domain-containing protein n=1 Tax=Nissabacter archeti TaxID=1917880 RepID=A0ABS5JI26_9GAMM|nr:MULTISPECIES: type 1 glutamine amidotransferase domain-containing protein [Yersiniaceae]MBS0969579.1 type 1 glutamine amidotransferase domain-containing protein [Nissabacter archeti]MDV5142318.1 type 1 glutamine amidotransferase domain-containing protein [Chimaeribacter arupi]PLR35265.1 type 1 glutamine amidotransferase domain-containing protein [Chimaeribacter arupi]PLR44061.1 type 1 glutamine amidotransferase domain-containing protein [Chimaeribacter arupi]PLR48472.1 type 1 glutamine amid
MKILMVMTSHDQLGDTGKKTGFWLEEFAAPYYEFIDAGAEVTVASPKGGQPPLDPKSDEPDAQTAHTERFRKDDSAQQVLANTLTLDAVNANEYDAVFYPGGHGPLWDLVDDRKSIMIINTLYAAGKPVAAVCHAPIVLRNAEKPDGTPLVQDKRVTGFSNSEEDAVGLTKIVPYLVEDELKRMGGEYSKEADWKSYVIDDGHLVTGQNPGSSAATAQMLLKKLDV